MVYDGPYTDPEGFTASTGSVLIVEKVRIGDGTNPALDLANEIERITTGRVTRTGDYAILTVNNVLWMSDTDAELHDHAGCVAEMTYRPGPVLIHGLGLGLVTAAALRLGHDVDVVDIDVGTWELVGPWLTDLAAEHDVTVTFHHGDALKYRWPKGKTWAVVWHDIWPTVTSDNLDDMGRLHRRFGRRSAWQGSWCHLQCQRMARAWKLR